MTYEAIVRLAQVRDRNTSFFVDAWPRSDGLYDLTIKVYFPNRNCVTLYREAVKESEFAPVNLFPSATMMIHQGPRQTDAS